MRTPAAVGTARASAHCCHLPDGGEHIVCTTSGSRAARLPADRVSERVALLRVLNRGEAPRHFRSGEGSDRGKCLGSEEDRSSTGPHDGVAPPHRDLLAGGDAGQLRLTLHGGALGVDLQRQVRVFRVRRSNSGSGTRGCSTLVIRELRTPQSATSAALESSTVSSRTCAVSRPAGTHRDRTALRRARSRSHAGWLLAAEGDG